MIPRLKEQYDREVRTKLMERFGITNVMAVPRLKKIVINMGCKGAVENRGRIDSALRDLSTITGQRPTIRNARKSIASRRAALLPQGAEFVSSARPADRPPENLHWPHSL
jgi:large subunit ribosomal protein L5